MFADYKTRYPKDLTAIEILEGTLAKAPEMYARTGTKIQGVMNQPGDESAFTTLQGSSGEDALFQSYPNPFNPETTIVYQLPEAGHVSLKIYSILGQEIRTLVDDEKQAGYHRVIWDGRNDVGLRVESGMYFVRIESGQAFVRTRKVVLLK